FGWRAPALIAHTSVPLRPASFGWLTLLLDRPPVTTVCGARGSCDTMRVLGSSTSAGANRVRALLHMCLVACAVAPPIAAVTIAQGNPEAAKVKNPVP